MPVAEAITFVNNESVATSISNSVPGLKAACQVKVATEAMPLLPSAGSVNVAAGKFTSKISSVTEVDFVTDGEVPVIVRLYVPVIEGVSPVISNCTGVLSFTAVAGVNVPVAPAGSPDTENTVVSLNARKVLYIKL